MGDEEFLNQLEATILEAQSINRAGKLIRADEIKMSLTDADRILRLSRSGLSERNRSTQQGDGE